MINYKYLAHHQYAQNLGGLSVQDAILNAAESGNIERVKCLISKYKVKPGLFDNIKENPHFSDFLDEEFDAMMFPKVQESSPVLQAVRSGNREMVEYLVSDFGLAPNPLISESQDEGGYLHIRPLFEAIHLGHVAIVEFLLSCGVDPDLLDSSNNCAVAYAVGFGQGEVVELLAAYGAKLSAPYLGQRQPLDFALASENLALCRILMKRGVVLNERQLCTIDRLKAKKLSRDTSEFIASVKSMLSKSPLLLAVVDGDLAAIEYLIISGRVSPLEIIQIRRDIQEKKIVFSDQSQLIKPVINFLKAMIFPWTQHNNHLYSMMLSLKLEGDPEAGFKQLADWGIRPSDKKYWRILDISPFSKLDDPTPFFDLVVSEDGRKLRPTLASRQAFFLILLFNRLAAHPPNQNTHEDAVKPSTGKAQFLSAVGLALSYIIFDDVDIDTHAKEPETLPEMLPELVLRIIGDVLNHKGWKKSILEENSIGALPFFST